LFFCKECGQEEKKWFGKCPNCQVWNSAHESLEKDEKKEKKNKINRTHNTIEHHEDEQLSEVLKCDIYELNRVCTMFKKSTLLIGGEPGIGKSTLMSQIAGKIEGNCLYLAGEESIGNIRNRMKRVCQNMENIQIVNFFFIGDLAELLEKYRPDLVILDSIHTTRSEDSSNPKEIILQINFLARKYNCCFLIVSHITKDGIIAGPKMLEHMVDVVLYLEGDRYGRIRFLRSIKNRFGPTDETGIFEMAENGMVEVLNPSAILISNKVHGASGSVVFAGISGSRPLLIEIQALITESNFPQTETVGFNAQRLKMILAILQKWCNIKLWKHDIFINIVGGIKISDPTLDLAVAVAILSSYKNRSISPEVCFFGELGLIGEIRQTNDFNIRVKEALRLNFTKIYGPINNGPINNTNNFDKDRDKICNVKNIKDLFKIL